jgi:hypothetical protein
MLASRPARLFSVLRDVPTLVTILLLLAWLWLAGLTLLSFLNAGVRRHHFEAAGLVFGSALLIVALWRSQASSLCPAATTARSVWPMPFLLGLITYAWSISLGPLSDDYVIGAWAKVGDWAPDTWPHLRPLPLALWSGILAAGGAWGTLHLLNVVLHAANSALVAKLASYFGGYRAGLVAGLLFAVYPGSVEAVAWTAGVFELFSTFLVLRHLIELE